MTQFQQAKKYLLLTLSLLLAGTSYSQAATMTAKSEAPSAQESTPSLLEKYQKTWFLTDVIMDGLASALIVVCSIFYYFSNEKNKREIGEHLAMPIGVCFVLFPSIIIPIVRLFIFLFFKGKDDATQAYRKNICRPVFYTDLSACAASIVCVLTTFSFFTDSSNNDAPTIFGKILLCFAGFVFPIASMVIRGVLYSGKFPTSRTRLTNLKK